MNQIATYFRLPVSMLLALLMTLSLFYLMKVLIETDEIDLDESKTFIVTIVKALEMTPLVVDRGIKPDFTPPEIMPEIPRISLLDGPVIEIGGPWLTPEVDVGEGLAIGLSDGNYLPIVKVQPVYPRKALQRGIEGYSIVAFDVGADGSVRNPRVIESEPGTMFNAASIKAALRFRYKPRIEEGQAIAVTGVRNRFTFELSSQ